MYVCVRVFVKQSVSVLTAMSHAADQSRGILRWELLITPLCMIPIFNPSNRDLRVVRMTCLVGGYCFAAGAEGRTGHEKKFSRWHEAQWCSNEFLCHLSIIKVRCWEQHHSGRERWWSYLVKQRLSNKRFFEKPILEWSVVLLFSFTQTGFDYKCIATRALIYAGMIKKNTCKFCTCKLTCPVWTQFSTINQWVVSLLLLEVKCLAQGYLFSNCWGRV